ncbi:unnamed protein product [Adineta ricciae]|uniref:Dynein light chain Tctex-type 1 n=1 Tax=Adineta ricciae TaxID=249248 RepID=A0A813PB68_ADIRI|nr:unnamed protein product [Adineta ricciae]
MSGEDTSFVIDEVSNIIKDTIERIIGGNSYQHNKVNRWTADIVDHVLTELTKLGKPFKYIVQAVIMQKNGAGLHTASSCYWDNTTDGSCTLGKQTSLRDRFRLWSIDLIIFVIVFIYQSILYIHSVCLLHMYLER